MTLGEDDSRPPVSPQPSPSQPANPAVSPRSASSSGRDMSLARLFRETPLAARSGARWLYSHCGLRLFNFSSGGEGGGGRDWIVDWKNASRKSSRIRGKSQTFSIWAQNSVRLSSYSTVQYAYRVETRDPRWSCVIRELKLGFFLSDSKMWRSLRYANKQGLKIKNKN